MIVYLCTQWESSTVCYSLSYIFYFICSRWAVEWRKPGTHARLRTTRDYFVEIKFQQMHTRKMRINYFIVLLHFLYARGSFVRSSHHGSRCSAKDSSTLFLSFPFNCHLPCLHLAFCKQASKRRTTKWGIRRIATIVNHHLRTRCEKRAHFIYCLKNMSAKSRRDQILIASKSANNRRYAHTQTHRCAAPNWRNIVIFGCKKWISLRNNRRHAVKRFEINDDSKRYQHARKSMAIFVVACLVAKSFFPSQPKPVSSIYTQFLVHPFRWEYYFKRFSVAPHVH